MPSQITAESLKASLEKRFGNIEEPRINGKISHKLIDTITIAIMAVLCGPEGGVAVKTYGISRKEWLE